jgi:putative phage-type endonuclease
MKTHQLIQGSLQWLAYRANHFNASDAPAMMGLSPYTTRTQLLHQLHTGIAPEVDAGTQRRFDDGHRFEALARPLAEKIIGEDLYPVVGSEGKLSASFDGLTMAEETGFEHKSLNEHLRTVMVDGCTGADLPPMYQIQMEQQCMVAGCDRILFMASKWMGDELVEERHCWYETNLDLHHQIMQGWTQFAIDLEAYVPPEVIVPAVAAPQMGLPAVSIAVNGSITLVDNLEKVGVVLNAYIERINKKPKSDQDFADLEATVKTLKAFEESLAASESNALAQVDSVDAMRKTVALYQSIASTNRLLVDKIVKAEKENRRIAIVSDAVAELVTHVKKLNERLGKPYMPSIAGDFQGVIKGLKSLDSMNDKVSGELARCKIAANEAADRILANLATLRELASEHAFLFADTAQLVGKANDDLTALVKSRIADHKAAEAAKEEATRERIRAEEQAKAEKEAREKLAAEQAAFEQQEQEEIARLAKLNTTMVAEAAPAVTHEVVAKIMMPPAVRQAMAPKADTAPTLTLGEISGRLGFNVTSAFLATLGFEATTVKAAKLFQAEDFDAIGKAIIEHIENVCMLQAA